MLKHEVARFIGSSIEEVGPLIHNLKFGQIVRWGIYRISSDGVGGYSVN